MALTRAKSLQIADTLRAAEPLRPAAPLRAADPLTLSNTYPKKVRVISLKGEAANSYADVLLGGMYGTQELRRTLENNNLEYVADIPLLNKAVGVLALTKNQFIDPIVDKGARGFIDVGLNTLINASETLDVFANVVKSQIPLAGGSPGFENLAESLGLGDSESRKVYNYNTGTFIGDLILEVISDPLNWLSFGGKAVADVAVDTTLKTTRELTEAVVRNNMDAVAKNFTEYVSKESIDDIVEVAAKRVTKTMVDETIPKVSFSDIMPALKNKTINELDTLAKALPDVNVPDAFDKTFSDLLNTATNASAKHLRQYRAATQFKGAVKKYVEDPLTLAAYPNILLPYRGLQKLNIGNILKKISNNIYSKFKKYVDIKPTNDVSAVMNTLADSVFKESNAYFSNQINELQKVLNPLGVSVKKLQYELLAYLRNINYQDFNTALTKEQRLEFISWLLDRGVFNKLTVGINAKEELTKIFLNKYADDVIDAVDLLALGPKALRQSEVQLLNTTDSKRMDQVLQNYYGNRIIKKTKTTLKADTADVVEDVATANTVTTPNVNTTPQTGEQFFEELKKVATEAREYIKTHLLQGEDSYQIECKIYDLYAFTNFSAGASFIYKPNYKEVFDKWISQKEIPDEKLTHNLMRGLVLMVESGAKSDSAPYKNFPEIAAKFIKETDRPQQIYIEGQAAKFLGEGLQHHLVYFVAGLNALNSSKTSSYGMQRLVYALLQGGDDLDDMLIALYRHFPELFDDVINELKQAILRDYAIAKRVLNPNAVVEAPTSYTPTITDAPKKYKRKSKKGKNKPATPSKKAPDILDKLNYVDRVVLSTTTTKYGIDKLPDFIKDCIVAKHLDNALPYQQRALIAQMLDDLGININNYKRIGAVLHNKKYTRSQKIYALRKIMAETSQDPRFLSSEFINNLNKATQKQMKNKVNETMLDAIKQIRDEKDILLDIKKPRNPKKPKDYKLIQNLQDAMNRLKTNKNFKAYDFNLYIKGVLRNNQFIASSNLHRDLKTWTDGLLDVKLENKISRVIDYITKTEAITSAISNANTLEELQRGFKTDIIDWYKEMPEVYANLKTVRQQLFDKFGNMANDPKRASLLAFIDDSINIIETMNNSGMYENLADYIHSFQDIEFLQLSYRGKFDLMMQHTNITNDSKPNPHYSYKVVMQELMDPNSKARKHIIPLLLDAYRKADLPNQAQMLEEVVAQIDTTVALQKLLNSDLNLHYLTTKQERYAVTLLFDMIKNSNLNYLEVVDNPNAFDEGLKNIAKNINRYLNDVPSNNVYINNDVPLSIWGTDIRINKNVTVKDILDYLRTEEPEHNFIEDSVNLSRAYKEMLQEGWTDDDITNLFMPGDTHDPKLFMYLLGTHLLEIRDFSVASYKQALAKTIADMKIKNTRNSEILAQLQSILDNYITDLSKLNKDDFPIYSLYSLNTIKQIGIITANFPKFVDTLNVSDIRALAGADVIMEFMDTFADAIQEGLDVIIKRSKQISSYVEYQEASKELFKQGLARNLFDASVESELYTFKHVINEDTDAYFNLDINQFIGNSSEYVMLNNKLAWLKSNHMLTADVIMLLDNPSYVECMRESLIQTYKRTNALFGMHNAKAYFNSLEPMQIYYWNVLTRGSASKNNKRFYIEYFRTASIRYKIDANKVTSEFNSNLEKIMSDKVYVPDNAFDNAINVMQTTQYEELSAYIDATFLKTPISVDALGKYKEQIIEAIQADIIVKDDVLRRLYELNKKNVLDTLPNARHNMLIERKTSLAHIVSRMSPQELRTYIDKNTPGGIIFYNNNLIEVFTKENDVLWKGFNKPFNYTDEAFTEAGLKKVVVGDYIIIRPTSNEFDPVDLKYTRNKYRLETEQEEITKILDDYVNYLNREDMDVPLDLTTVESIPQTLWENIMQDPEFQQAFGDASEQILYQNPNFFNKSYSRLNYTVLGGYNALEQIQSRYAVDDTYVHYSTDLIKHTMSGMMSFLTRSNRTKKYISLFFNEDYTLSSKLFGTALNSMSNKELKEFFEQGDYKTIILRLDKTGQPAVYDYYVFNKKSLSEAKKAGAILVPKDTATAIKQVVNNRPLDYSAWSLYKRIVVPLYKGLDLLTVGFPFRNFIDSVIYKNATELGLDAAVKYDLTAMKLLKFHDEVQQKVLRETANQTFDKETLFKILSNYSEEEQRVYFLVDLFVNSSASSGYSKSFAEYLEQYNKIDDIREAWEIMYNDKIINGDYSPIKWVNDINNNIEQTARLGLFLGSINEGLPIPDAIKKVNLTHFNYNDRTPFLEFCELIFWFSTFPINNINYYLTHGLLENPMLLRTLVDAQTVSWNNGEYTYEELKKTNFLAYHALTGNLRMGNTILKLSPSVFDVINILTNPLDSILDRLNPFLGIPVDLLRGDNPLNDLNPFSTQLNNAKHFIKGNPIPSILSFLNEKDNYPTTLYGQRRYRNTWNKYPRIKKPRRNMMYPTKFYARKYRWWRYRGNISALSLNQYGTKRMTTEYATDIKMQRALRSFKAQRRFTKA